MEIIIGASIGGAICGYIIAYYVHKGIADDLTEKNAYWVNVTRDQRKTIEELKKKNIGLIKINYTLQQEPKPENGYTISVDERRMKVLEMRKNGLKYRDIGKILNVSHTTAINDYKRIKEAV